MPAPFDPILRLVPEKPWDHHLFDIHVVFKQGRPHQEYTEVLTLYNVVLIWTSAPNDDFKALDDRERICFSLSRKTGRLTSLIFNNIVFADLKGVRLRLTPIVKVFDLTSSPDP